MKYVRIMKNITGSINMKGKNPISFSTKLGDNYLLERPIDVHNSYVNLYEEELLITPSSFIKKSSSTTEIHYYHEIPEDFLHMARAFLVRTIYDLSPQHMDTKVFNSKKDIPIIRIIFDADPEEILLLKLSI